MTIVVALFSSILYKLDPFPVAEVQCSGYVHISDSWLVSWANKISDIVIQFDFDKNGRT